jgi:hypothetical protein
MKRDMHPCEAGVVRAILVSLEKNNFICVFIVKHDKRMWDAGRYAGRYEGRYAGRYAGRYPDAEHPHA